MNLTYLFYILLIGFSVFSFAADEKEMPKKAEAGNRQAIITDLKEGVFRETEPRNERLGGFTLGESRLDVDRLGHNDSIETESTTNNKAEIADYEKVMRVHVEDWLKKAEANNLEAMRYLYEFYKDVDRSAEADLWLKKLKDIANKGDVKALTIVYQITNKILSSGVQAAVVNSLDFITMDTGLRPKIVFMKNVKTVHDNIIKQITTPAPNQCSKAFL